MAKSHCTWEGCAAQAAHDMLAQDGQLRAKLCDPHKLEFDAAVSAPGPQAVLRAWVKVQGGSKAAAERF